MFNNISTNAGYYEYLGRSATFKVPGKSLTLTCLVYEQLVPEPAVPCFEEVAASAWAPFAVLLSDQHVRRVRWSSLSGHATGKGWDGYPSVLLPIKDLVMANRNAQQDVQYVTDRFVLWGVTLHIINTMLVQCKLRDTPIDFDLLDRLDAPSYPSDDHVPANAKL